MQSLPYARLLQALEIEDIRQLEDFIIQDCTYPGLIKCKFDQKNSCLHVSDVYNRDVKPGQLPALCQGLQEMCAL
jgi:hypothetical protein